MSIRSLGVLLLLVGIAGCRKDQEAARPADKPTTTAPSEPRQADTQRPAASAEPAAEAPVAVHVAEVDCTPAGARGKGITVKAPEGATCKEVAEALVIATPEGGELVIHETAADMAARKKAIESDTNNKLKRYTTDTPETIVYEIVTPSGTNGYNFVSTKKVGDKIVTCEGKKEASYTREQVEQLVMACRSLEKK